MLQVWTTYILISHIHQTTLGFTHQKTEKRHEMLETMNEWCFYWSYAVVCENYVTDWHMSFSSKMLAFARYV